MYRAEVLILGSVTHSPPCSFSHTSGQERGTASLLHSVQKAQQARGRATARLCRVLRADSPRRAAALAEGIPSVGQGAVLLLWPPRKGQAAPSLAFPGRSPPVPILPCLRDKALTPPRNLLFGLSPKPDMPAALSQSLSEEAWPLPLPY